MPQSAVIALLTDFGPRNPEVGVLKGTLLSVNPAAHLVDLSHDIGDVASARAFLKGSHDHFPDGTIFLASVGTSRSMIAVETARHQFVASDKRLLSFLPKRAIRRTNRVDQLAAAAARLSLGVGGASTSDIVAQIETNLDNVSGEVVGYLFERLFAEGALDVFTTPIQMKKSRPAVLLSVLAPVEKAAALEKIILAESPTFGVRRCTLERRKLDREIVVARTRYGRIRCKVGRLDGASIRTAPEYEDVRAAAARHRVPLSKVQEAARDALRIR